MVAPCQAPRWPEKAASRPQAVATAPAAVALQADEGLQCAAAQWLCRLRRDEVLPEKGLLETLRRQEFSARKHAQALAESEGQRALLLQECLENQKRLHEQRGKLLEEAQVSIRAEQRLRLDAETALSAGRARRLEAEQALAEEINRRKAAEVHGRAAEEKVVELTRVLADDQSLVVLDEFREKLRVQREEVCTLRERLAASKESGSSTAADLQRLRHHYDTDREQWGQERYKLLQEHAAAQLELAQLRKAGASLQAAAEGALASCARLSASQTAQAAQAAQPSSQDESHQTAPEDPAAAAAAFDANADEALEELMALEPFLGTIMGSPLMYTLPSLNSTS
ncbi:unnamed protein product [Polarella glacialis]|uniref:Uncharacterized protein n=1 Tax=Polarella glacialis TaxID=89957 RepID=A0A813JS86_POLGL|nr:unnamed protein product [Polarella glacialis]CAE8603889.1 unnamed protein product [Polarella glacialis]CAE8685186.1 unnamed protein product [Polarella glacialis]